LRENVFLPAHLSKPHRDLVFGGRHRKVLEDDPVIVEVAEEKFRLKHIDRTQDEPSTIEALFKAVSLMEDKKDWQNLPILLEGLATSGRTVKLKYLQKLVRKAGMAGRQSVILECARRASKTAFVLNDLNLIRDVMWWIQHKPLSTKWNAATTKKALTMAEQTAVLLEDEQHLGGFFRGAADPRGRPEVVGILLQLAAAHAKLSSGKDEDGKVELYARRFLGTLTKDVDLRKRLPVRKELWARSTLLCHISPMLYGIREAVKILGPESETAKGLKKQEPKLRAIAAKEREILGDDASEGPRLGGWCYDRLVGSEAV
jgi:hypothetical protein